MEGVVQRSQEGFRFLAVFNPHTRQRFMDMCIHHSRIAIPAPSLEHARVQLQAIGDHGFDAVAIDAYLAEVNGFQFIRTVRDALIRPAVYLTHDFDPPVLREFMDRAAASGIDHFFTAVRWVPTDPFTNLQVATYIHDSYVQGLYEQGITVEQAIEEGLAEIEPAEGGGANGAAEGGAVDVAGIAAQGDDEDPTLDLSLAPPAAR